MAKLVVTRGLVGRVVYSSYVTHQKVIRYSWILAITLAHSPLKSTSSTTAFNRQNGRVTCQFQWRVTQLAAGSFFGRKSPKVGRKSLDGLVCHSARSYIGCKSLLKFLFHANFCRIRQVTRGGSSGADNCKNRSNYDTSTRFGPNTLWGSLFKKKTRATQNFNMAAIFQDGRHGTSLNVIFCLQNDSKWSKKMIVATECMLWACKMCS